MLEITEAASEVLERAYEAAATYDPSAKIRVFKRRDGIVTGFAHEPSEGDHIIEHQGMTLYVAAEVDGTLDTSEEHDRLIVRPA